MCSIHDYSLSEIQGMIQAPCRSRSTEHRAVAIVWHVFSYLAPYADIQDPYDDPTGLSSLPPHLSKFVRGSWSLEPRSNCNGDYDQAYVSRTFPD